MFEHQEEKINAATNEDIMNILISKGIWERILAGEVHCISCNEVITKDDIGALLIEDEVIKVCCNSLSCIDKIRK